MPGSRVAGRSLLVLTAAWRRWRRRRRARAARSDDEQRCTGQTAVEPGGAGRGLHRADRQRALQRGRISRSCIPTAASPTARPATSTAPSPISTRRSASTRTTCAPTSTAATPTSPSATTTAPSPASSQAIRLEPKNVRLMSRATARSQGRLERHRRLRPGAQARSQSAAAINRGLPSPQRQHRPRHRRLRSGDPAQPEGRRGLQQPRHRLRRQGRLRPRRRRLRSGAQARPELRAGLPQPRPDLARARRTTTAPSPISIRRSGSRPTTPRPTTTAAPPSTPRASSTARSPISTGPSRSIRATPASTTTAATSGATRAGSTARSRTTTRRSRSRRTLRSPSTTARRRTIWPAVFPRRWPTPTRRPRRPGIRQRAQPARPDPGEARRARSGHRRSAARRALDPSLQQPADALRRLGVAR